jgi:uncharacterized OB-fold protein
MSGPERYQWRRDKDGLGVWEHRGKVAVAGVGHSPVDRRWDGVSMDKTLGAYSILACRKAMDEAGVTPDQPYNLAMVTLDADPRVNFYSNLPGIPPYQAPVGAAVEVTFEEVAPGQLFHEWRVAG